MKNIRKDFAIDKRTNMQLHKNLSEANKKEKISESAYVRWIIRTGRRSGFTIQSIKNIKRQVKGISTNIGQIHDRIYVSETHKKKVMNEIMEVKRLIDIIERM